MVAVWTVLDLGPAQEPGLQASAKLRHVLLCGLALTFITIVTGAFVAGLDGGKIYNTFPLMGGQVVPPGDLAISSWWRNALENPAAAQFHHRLVAIFTGVFLLLSARAARQPGLPPALRHAAWVMAMLVVMQVTLGITTLSLAVPVTLGVLHQFTGVRVLTAAVVTVHRARVACGCPEVALGRTA